MEIKYTLDAQLSSTISSQEILRLVHVLSRKMIDPDQVKQRISKSSNTSPSYQGSPFAPLPLSHGYPALLLLFSTMDHVFSNENWEDVCHEYILKIKEHIESDGLPNLSLFGGASGVAFSILSASKKGTRYQKLLEKINAFLIEKLESTYWPIFTEKNALGLPISIRDTDLMSGLTGVGTYFLSLDHVWNMKEVMKKILSHLIEYTKTKKINDHFLPGWYTPCHYQLIEEDKRIYPKGNFNLGMAHGIPGVLALFTQALAKGYELEGMLEAIVLIKDWVLSKQKEKWGTRFWVDRISYEEEVDGDQTRPYFTMDAWCYGSPGIARTLFLTGKVLNDPSLVHLATRAYRDIAKRIKEGGTLRNHSFCHGYAGLLSMVHLMARDTKEQELRDLVPWLQRKVLEGFSEKAEFGFFDSEPENNAFILNIDKEKEEPRMIQIEKIGLLDGTVGILLALLQSVTGETSWTQPFLLGGDL